MNYEVSITYDSLTPDMDLELAQSAAASRRAGGGAEGGGAPYITEPENQGRGFDFVKFADACGAKGERVTDPADIKAVFQRAVDSGVPYVVEIILERETDCSMGISIDKIREFE